MTSSSPTAERYGKDAEREAIEKRAASFPFDSMS